MVVSGNDVLKFLLIISNTDDKSNETSKRNPRLTITENEG
jgi:hypothetical protein